jgi:hypothetical protein
MSKKEQMAVADEEVVATEEMVNETPVEIDPDKVYATIIKDDEGNYHVVDEDGTVGPVCKLVDEGDRTIALTKNASNRKWFNRKKADEEIAEKGHVDLYYKASKTFGPSSSHIPNEKLCEKYLTPEEFAEYKAIIEEAYKRRDEDKVKPKTELQKAQERVAKAKAAYEKLLAQAAEQE